MIEEAIDAVDARIYLQDLRQMLNDIEATNGNKVEIRLLQYPSSTTFRVGSWRAY